MARRRKRSGSFRASLFAFFAGFVLVGGLDFMHTAIGIQEYITDFQTLPVANWPWFIPFQMGIAGLLLLWGWQISKKNFFEQIVRKDRRVVNRVDKPGPFLGISMVMVVIGYLLAWVLFGNSMHINWYLGLYLLSLIVITLSLSKFHILAFLLISITGVVAETLLLDPGLGYFQYQEADLLGRAPAWLLFVYGWVGIFIHELSKLIDQPRGGW